MKFAAMTDQLNSNQTHCACVIHGNGYDWSYVDKLYNMLARNLTKQVILHVYTESSRVVPAPYVKHELEDWGITGPKRSWWYKMQMFNSQHYSGPLLYFDLDTVVVGNIDWITELNQRYFWSIQDFKRLWRSTHQGINSSVMFWDTKQYHWVWEQFKNNNINTTVKAYRGDQDFITETLTQRHYRYLDPTRIYSWRWQCLDGGYNFKTKSYQNKNTGTKIPNNASVLVFHGNPKPHETTDPIIQHYWQ